MTTLGAACPRYHGKGKKYLSSPNRPVHCVKRLECEADYSTHLVPTLRMSDAILARPHIPTWRV